jgi:hypothetical protein
MSYQQKLYDRLMEIMQENLKNLRKNLSDYDIPLCDLIRYGLLGAIEHEEWISGEASLKERFPPVVRSHIKNIVSTSLTNVKLGSILIPYCIGNGHNYPGGKPFVVTVVSDSGDYFMGFRAQDGEGNNIRSRMVYPVIANMENAANSFVDILPSDWVGRVFGIRDDRTLNDQF